MKQGKERAGWWWWKCVLDTVIKEGLSEKETFDLKEMRSLHAVQVPDRYNSKFRAPEKGMC